MDRARRADAQFALDGQELDVARLVTRLDGMPLAIELAAARVEALGVSQLLERLDDRLELLAGGDWLAPSRQQSLAATVEWSYRLLDASCRVSARRTGEDGDDERAAVLDAKAEDLEGRAAGGGELAGPARRLHPHRPSFGLDRGPA